VHLKLDILISLYSFHEDGDLSMKPVRRFTFVHDLEIYEICVYMLGYINDYFLS